MTKFARIAAAATIALAALPLVAVGAAHAEPVATRIPLSKVDFSRADHVAKFNARIGAAQRQFCATAQKRTLTDAAACREAVRAEIVAQLSSRQRLALSGQTYAVARAD